MKILHFRQFYKHFVFVEDSDGGRKKLLKNYTDVNVCIDVVCGDTKTDFEIEKWLKQFDKDTLLKHEKYNI